MTIPNGKSVKKDLKALYNWGKWERNTFTLCGVKYHQYKDFTIRLDQEEYVKEIANNDFELPTGLKTMPDKTPLDARGLKCLRGINGTLQWLVTNSRVDLASKVSISASSTSNPTVEDLRKAYKLVRQAQREAGLPVHFHPIALDNFILGGFGDAAWAVRPDGSSQGGFLIYASHKSLMDGKEVPMSILDWKSWKLKRKVRSSLAAESQAMADLVDCTFVLCGLLASSWYRPSKSR